VHFLFFCRCWFTIRRFSNTSTSLGWKVTGDTRPPASSAWCWPCTSVTRCVEPIERIPLDLDRSLCGWLIFFLNISLLVRYQVTVFGFGADQYGNWHHYWEENTLSGAFRHTGVHDADHEYNVTLQLAEKHKIQLFRGRWYPRPSARVCVYSGMTTEQNLSSLFSEMVLSRVRWEQRSFVLWKTIFCWSVQCSLHRLNSTAVEKPTELQSPSDGNTSPAVCSPLIELWHMSCGPFLCVVVCLTHGSRCLWSPAIISSVNKGNVSWIPCYIYIYIYIYIFNIYIYMCVYIYTYIFIYIYMCVYIYIHIYIYTHTHICVHIYIIYTHIYVCIY